MNSQEMGVKVEEAEADRFAAAQPRIPGVPDAKARAEAAPRISSLPWLLGAICGVLAIGVIGAFLLMARRSHSAAVAEEATPHAAPGGTSVEAPLPTGPGEIATASELSRPWAAKRFNYVNPLTKTEIPAMLVHLPGGAYWAFSLREPYGGCMLEYVTDTKQIERDYFFHANHPMVVDPCDRSVFDLASYNQGDAGVVRGAIVHGPAVRPPFAIQVKVKGQKIEAVRME